MQLGNHDMENKFRQLESQQLPDLSRMDEHWRSMEAMLQPPVQPGAKTAKKGRWFLGLGVILVAAVVMLFMNGHEENKTVNFITKGDQTIKTAGAADQVKAMDEPVTVPTLTASKPRKALPVKDKERENDQATISLPLQLNTRDSTLVPVALNKQKLLKELFAELAKTAEEFTIDNRRDTVLLGAEGSSLVIPANSLGGNAAVKISLREFYKTADIVANKLSTTSNGQQLVTGGMVHISATVDDKPVNVMPGKTIRIFMPDTSEQMNNMELFMGEEKKESSINWINQGQNFVRPVAVTQVRVLYIPDEPFKEITDERGTIAFFAMSRDCKLSKAQLRSVLKEKYGHYYKIRIRRTWRSNIFHREKVGKIARFDEGINIGDSAWIPLAEAREYDLPWTESRIYQEGSYVNRSFFMPRLQRIKTDTIPGVATITYADTVSAFFEDNMKKLENRFSVDIRSLGWINCDRFYKNSMEKVTYAVNLNDSAVNFFTMLVFDNIRSMMTGYLSGNKVMFSNVPLGESVKIISIGINKTGETVIAMKETKISKDEFAGLEFEPSSTTAIRSSLNRTD